MRTNRIDLVLVIVAAALLATVAAPAQEQYLPRITFSPSLGLFSQQSPVVMPATFSLSFTGVDPDGATGLPVKYRYLVEPALIASGGYATTRTAVNLYMQDLVSFSDSTWSAWADWPQGDAEVQVQVASLPEFDDLSRRIYYVVALQAMDEAGAVNIRRDYGYNVGHFIVGEVSPKLYVYEPLLGSWHVDGIDNHVTMDIGYDTYAFQWVADAAQYGGEITDYRWGLDLLDPDDPDDPGWHDWGLGPEFQNTGPLTLGGIRTLVVQARDANGQISQIDYLLTVVPIPEWGDQLPLLLVDDVHDHASNAWPSQDGSVALDQDTYRDAFWLGALGVVDGFSADRDVIDTEDASVTLRDLVNYRTVIWTSRYASDGYSEIGREFRPAAPTVDPYNWLENYQKYAGNFVLTASRGTESFLLEASYAMPIIHESEEGQWWDGFDAGPTRIGFGHRELPDGTEIPVGPTRYPYRGLGLSVTDQMSPNSTAVLYGTDPLVTVRLARKPPCVGLKSLILDDAFTARHMPGGAAFAETTATESTIDWHDLAPSYYDDLLNPYLWGNDEFYENPGDRATPFTYQTCAGAPDDLCVEPMFRSQARFDWIREQHLAADPDDPWPEGYYSQPLSQLCGAYALADGDTTARTNDQVVGFFAHKLSAYKPNHLADVMWGFDPYRMDHAVMTDAIRWLLGDYFQLALNP